MKSKMLFFVLVSGLFFNVCLQPAYASVSSENAALARIVHELNALEPLINQAQAQQPQYTRVHFNYTQLRADIRKIKKGIQQQIKSAALEPRHVQPLSGDYVKLDSLQP